MIRLGRYEISDKQLIALSIDSNWKGKKWKSNILYRLHQSLSTPVMLKEDDCADIECLE